MSDEEEPMMRHVEQRDREPDGHARWDLAGDCVAMLTTAAKVA